VALDTHQKKLHTESAFRRALPLCRFITHGLLLITQQDRPSLGWNNGTNNKFKILEEAHFQAGKDGLAQVFLQRSSLSRTAGERKTAEHAMKAEKDCKSYKRPKRQRLLAGTTLSRCRDCDRPFI